MHKYGMNRKNKVQENPKKATWISWKRDEDNKSSIAARQEQRAYPRWKGDGNKSIHVDMPVEKRGILQRWVPRKRTTLKANLSSEEWMRKPNWVHITKNHMYQMTKLKVILN